MWRGVKLFIILFVISTNSGCPLSDPPPVPPPSPKFSVPITARNLPANHKIAGRDIELVIKTKFEMEQVPRADVQNQVMMAPSQIEGRVLRWGIPKGTVFLVTDFYLQGTEPGAPPEPPYEEPTWPPLAKIPILSEVLAQKSNDDVDGMHSIVVPIVAVDLPANRVLRANDVALVKFSSIYDGFYSESEYEILARSEPIIGRRLKVAKRAWEMFRLSDFEVNAELQDHLDKARHKEKK